MGFGSIVKGGQSIGNAVGSAAKGGAAVAGYGATSTTGVAGINAQGNSVGVDGSEGDLANGGASLNDDVGFEDSMAKMETAAQRKLGVIEMKQKFSDKVSGAIGQMGS